jgi:hypothetical protein
MSNEMFNNVTTPNSTTIDHNNIAYLYIAISAVLFGTNYIPVKSFKSGDGMFFQFTLCIGIWFVGCVLTAIRGCPQIYRITMFGGYFSSLYLFQKQFSIDYV